MYEKHLNRSMLPTDVRKKCWLFILIFLNSFNFKGQANRVAGHVSNWSLEIKDYKELHILLFGITRCTHFELRVYFSLYLQTRVSLGTHVSPVEAD